VGLSTKSNPEVRLRDVPYSFYSNVEEAFAFFPDKAGELQAQLKAIGFESELI
jgi:hypothetical protein